MRFTLRELMTAIVVIAVLAILIVAPRRAHAAGEAYDGPWIKDSNIASNGAISAARITGTAVTRTTAAQTDTNAVTVRTAYTPAFVGQMLVGQTGPGTSLVAVAKGTTTNDWVQVAP